MKLPVNAKTLMMPPGPPRNNSKSSQPFPSGNTATSATTSTTSTDSTNSSSSTTSPTNSTTKHGNNDKTQNYVELPMFHRRHEIMQMHYIEREMKIEQQFKYFVGRVTLTPKDVQVRNKILDELKDILTSVFPKCTLEPFGSFITGLGDQDSDIDIFVNLHGELPNSDFPPTNDSETFNNKKRASKQKVLDEVLKIVHRYPRRIFSSIVPIRSARIPIVKLTHAGSNLQCDLSFENLLSVQNSNLIAFYQKIDDRVKYLMIILRYWAKFHDISGSIQIKNYCLLLMILVFLAKKHIVPSIHTLQTLRVRRASAQEQEPKIEQGVEGNSALVDGVTLKVDGWNAGFNNNLEQVLAHMKNTYAESNQEFPLEINSFNGLPTTGCILKLVLAFFDLFANFEYDKLMICTLTSEFYLKSSFQTGYESELPPELDLYKDWACGQDVKSRLSVESPFCVQDPFQLNFNVAGCAKQVIVDKFKSCCQDGVKRVRDMLKALGESSSVGDPIPKLFDVFGERELANKLTKSQIRERRRQRKREREDFAKQVIPPLASQLLQSNSAVDQTRPLHEYGFTKSGSTIMFSPKPLFRAKYVFDQFNPLCAELSMIDESKVYSLWSTFVEEFLKQVFSLGYEMRIVSHEKQQTGNQNKIETGPTQLRSKVESAKSNVQPSLLHSASSSESLLDAIIGESPTPNLEAKAEAIESVPSFDGANATARSRQKRRLGGSPTSNGIKIEIGSSNGTTGGCSNETDGGTIKIDLPPHTHKAKCAKTETSTTSNTSFSDDVLVSNFEYVLYNNDDSHIISDGSVTPSAESSTDNNINYQALGFLSDALSKVPSLDSYDNTKFTFVIRGSRLFYLQHADMAKKVARETYDRATMNPIAFEGRVTKLALSKAGGRRAAAETFQFEVEANINLQEEEATKSTTKTGTGTDKEKTPTPTAWTPVLTIKFPPESGSHGFCTDFFIKKFETLLPEYLEYRFKLWIESVTGKTVSSTANIDK